jgi:hypothetical protein
MNSDPISGLSFGNVFFGIRFPFFLGFKVADLCLGGRDALAVSGVLM